jgi:hypothetical protein
MALAELTVGASHQLVNPLVVDHDNFLSLGVVTDPILIARPKDGGQRPFA